MDEPERPRNPKPFWFMIPYLLSSLFWIAVSAQAIVSLRDESPSDAYYQSNIKFDRFLITPAAFGVPMFVAGMLFYFGGKTRRNLTRVKWIQALALITHLVPFLFATYMITPGPRGDFGGSKDVGFAQICSVLVCVPHFSFCLLMFLCLWTKAVKDRYIGYEIDAPTPDTAS